MTIAPTASDPIYINAVNGVLIDPRREEKVRARSTLRALKMKSLIPCIENVEADTAVSLAFDDTSTTESDCGVDVCVDVDEDKDEDEDDVDDTNKTLLWFKRITEIQKQDILFIVHNIVMS